jgi:hypothetical protein
MEVEVAGGDVAAHGEVSAGMAAVEATKKFWVFIRCISVTGGQ